MRPGDKIGEGSSRIVYTYSNTKVIKMAKNLAGKRQNENEASIEKSLITPTVYKHAPDFDWIVTDHVHPITKNTFESLLGIPPNDFYNYACNYIEDKIPCDQKIIDTFLRQTDIPMHHSYRKIIEESEVAQAILKHSIKFNSPIGELSRYDSWGILRGKLTLLDYGLTYDIYFNCYKILEDDYILKTDEHHIFKKGCVVPLELFDNLRPVYKSPLRKSI